MTLTVAVTGSSGFIGSALVSSLRASGDAVVRLVRRPVAPGAPDEASWDPEGGTIDRAALEGVDAVVHLAGEGIGERRWSDAQKQRILSSRVKGTSLVASTLAAMGADAPVLVSGSAVGYYGLRGDEVLTEASSPGTGFLADVVKAWEGATEPASAAGVRVVLLRTGIVLGRHGALGRMLPFFKAGIGGRLGSGRQWWPWVALDDVVGVVRHAITTPSLSGPMNATAPNPARNAEVARALGRVLHRPSLLPVPAFALSLLMGRELTHEVILAGQRAVPAAAEASGYRFAHPDLEPALQVAVGRA
jgi:uncharacterized protein (TIGR01777 family)